jgi:hypothetical protein
MISNINKLGILSIVVCLVLVGFLFGFTAGVKTAQDNNLQEIKDFFDSKITPRLSNGNLTANVSFITDTNASVTIVILHAYESNQTFRLWSNITFNEQTNEKITFQKDYYHLKNQVWVKYELGE